MSAFKNLLGPVFESFTNKILSREDAYLVSKYGRRITEAEMLKVFLRNVRELIKEKMVQNEYSLVTEIPEPLVKYKEAFAEFYNHKLDYGIAFISGDDLNKLGFTIGQFTTNCTYMFLSWEQTEDSKEKLIPIEEVNKIINSSSN